MNHPFKEKTKLIGTPRSFDDLFFNEFIN